MLWSTLGSVLPQSLGPAAVLISVGVDLLRGGKIELVKLVTAGSYVSLVSASMKSMGLAKSAWNTVVAECKNIDAVLR